MSQDQPRRKRSMTSPEKPTGCAQSDEDQKEQANGDSVDDSGEKQVREKEEEKKKKKKKQRKRKRTSKLLSEILNERESLANSKCQEEQQCSAKLRDHRALTIAEALEEAAEKAGDKPVEMSDVAAITVAEAIAMGCGDTPSSSVASRAMAAATANERVDSDEQKIKLRDVLSDAVDRMLDDKIPDRLIAARVAKAEKKHSITLSTYPGGVADSVLNAALRNEGKDV